MRRTEKVVFFTLILCSLTVPHLLAQWSNDATSNTIVSDYQQDQREAAVVGNDQREVMIFWRDYRSEPSIFGGDIYGQKLDSAGYKLLNVDGLPIFSGLNGQFGVQGIPDGKNGAIVAWLSNRGGFYENDIYTQHLSAEGTLLWAAGGVPLSVMNGTASEIKLIGDDESGAIIVWQYLSGNYDIYAQRVDSSGTILWGANGLIVCDAGEAQLTPAVAGDGNGGAIITWQDSRNGAGTADIYAQRISADGQALWQDSGVVVCSAENGQSNPQIIADGQGGAVIVWDDLRTLDNTDIYAQRISASGTTLWQANGVIVCGAANTQSNPVIVTDGSGGALITWHDMRSNSAYDIYAQHLDGAGQAQWTANGIGVCTALHNQQYPLAVGDGSGGMILCWQDDRNGDLGDIYAQRVSEDGSLLWNTDGAAICLASDYQSNPALTCDGNGGAVIAWEDQRGGADFNIYAQWIDAKGNLGGITSIKGEYPLQPLGFTLYQNYPNPFNPYTRIRYQIASRSNSSVEVQLTVYNTLGQAVRRLVNEKQQPGTYQVTFDARNLPSGVYYYRMQTTDQSIVKKMILLQ